MEITEEDAKKYQLSLRNDGKTPLIAIDAECLAEATHKAIVACHDLGCRRETPKHRVGMSLGYDADMIIRVNNPDSEPKICNPGIVEDARGLVQYMLEVTHGIHNHWKRDPNNPEDAKWGYLYNERFVDQLPFVFARIKHDWDKKPGEWPNGMNRASGRDYNFTIWRPWEDIVIEQDDAPCFQRGQIRLSLDAHGELVMDYQTDWRSRDLLKAWNENNIGQVELMKLMRDKISAMLGGVKIKLGAYIDRSSSLHLYGLYKDRDNLESQVAQMKRDGWQERSMSLDNFLEAYDKYQPCDRTTLKRIVGVQSAYELKTGSKNAGISTLQEAGYDIATFQYPAEWDTWPKSWDAEPNIEALHSRPRIIIP